MSFRIQLALWFFANGIAASAQNIVTTYAGGGSGNGFTAQALSLAYYALATDTAGNIYVADDHHVYKISSGLVTLVAGDGGHGYRGDGGLATRASISTLQGGLAVDAGGNIYIAQQNAATVCRVDAITGRITALVTSSSFSFSNLPYGIAIAPNGDVYYASGDITQPQVFKLTEGTGVVSVFAGTGVSGNSGDGGPATSAHISSVRSLAVDPTGDIYLATGPSIRKVAHDSGVITTVAQQNATSITFDTSGQLYFASGTRVSKMNVQTGAVSVVAGGGSSSADGIPATTAALEAPQK